MKILSPELHYDNLFYYFALTLTLLLSAFKI